MVTVSWLDLISWFLTIISVVLFELTPENWTGPIVQVESVQRGKHNVRATSIHTGVQGPGGAGRAYRRQGQGRPVLS
jgi:hypothetical protein